MKGSEKPPKHKCLWAFYRKLISGGIKMFTDAEIKEIKERAKKSQKNWSSVVVLGLISNIEALKKDSLYTDMDWKLAEHHLSECEAAYSEIGSAGRFTFGFVINPLRDRFNKGERTGALFDEIMSIKL
jgi:hypothetical protein